MFARNFFYIKIQVHYIKNLLYFRNGHGLSLTHTHIPSFGDQLTAAGRVGLVNTPDHRLTANAFTTQNRPNIPNFPNFNTHGGGLDYMYKLVYLFYYCDNAH